MKLIFRKIPLRQAPEVFSVPLVPFFVFLSTENIKLKRRIAELFFLKVHLQKLKRHIARIPS